MADANHGRAVPAVIAVPVEKIAAITSTTKEKVSVHKHLIYSGISGAIATTCIYPMDIVKTKLQDTKGRSATATYRSPVQVARVLWNAEGLKGLYRGWPPSVILVMPEKALKLTLNAKFREHLSDAQGRISLGAEMFAGGLAGFCQVAATNPMELLKIQGATIRDKVAAGSVREVFSYSRLIRNLGVSGLYTGVVATWLRDVPFSMIYFAAYANTARTLTQRRARATGNMEALSQPPSAGVAFTSGVVAGTTAAAITTPLDVAKTRVHSNAVAAKLDGSGLECVRQFFARETTLFRQHVSSLWINEGPTAFFKGIVPRCMIISPLFGITMLCYEQFKKAFGT